MKYFHLVPVLNKVTFGLALLLGYTSASADQFYVTAGFDCKPNDAVLVIWFEGSSNEAGEKKISNLPENGFAPSKLVQFTQDASGVYSIKRKTESRVCNIGATKYSVEILPVLAFGFHPEGFCASRVGARIIVRRRQKIIVDEGLDGCTEKGEVTTRVTVRNHQEPMYEKISAEEFYGR